MSGYVEKGSFRRRLMMDGYLNRYRDEWYTIRTRVYNSNTTLNICRNNKVNNSQVYVKDTFDKMILADGTDIGLVTFYNFGDNSYHTVYLKPQGDILYTYMWGTSNYTINYLRIPKTIKTIQSTGFRGLGASQNTSVILDSDTPPTMLGANTTGTSLIKIYVPDVAVNTYKAASYWSSLSSKIYPISDYTGEIY